MITTFENRGVLKFYVIVLIPIFDTTYKGKNRSKYTCELYITNWSYSYKVGIVFAMYQIMRPKGKSWAGPRHSWSTNHGVSRNPFMSAPYPTVYFALHACKSSYDCTITWGILSWIHPGTIVVSVPSKTGHTSLFSPHWNNMLFN